MWYQIVFVYDAFLCLQAFSSGIYVRKCDSGNDAQLWKIFGVGDGANVIINKGDG